jgi:hypothetical protein
VLHCWNVRKFPAVSCCCHAGFPPVEPIKAAPAADKTARAVKQSAAAALGDSMREVVGSWRTWLLAVTYFFVYLIRQGCTSWLVFYLLEAKGAVDAAAAALTVSGEPHWHWNNNLSGNGPGKSKRTAMLCCTTRCCSCWCSLEFGGLLEDPLPDLLSDKTLRPPENCCCCCCCRS